MRGVIHDRTSAVPVIVMFDIVVDRLYWPFVIRQSMVSIKDAQMIDAAIHQLFENNRNRVIIETKHRFGSSSRKCEVSYPGVITLQQ
jgi:hypothetical protein